MKRASDNIDIKVEDVKKVKSECKEIVTPVPDESLAKKQPATKQTATSHITPSAHGSMSANVTGISVKSI